MEGETIWDVRDTSFDNNNSIEWFSQNRKPQVTLLLNFREVLTKYVNKQRIDIVG